MVWFVLRIICIPFWNIGFLLSRSRYKRKIRGIHTTTTPTIKAEKDGHTSQWLREEKSNEFVRFNDWVTKNNRVQTQNWKNRLNHSLSFQSLEILCLKEISLNWQMNAVNLPKRKMLMLVWLEFKQFISFVLFLGNTVRYHAHFS